MYRDHFSRLSILIVTFMGCHYRTTTIIRRKKDAKNTQFSFHFCLYVVYYIFKLCGSHGERVQFCDRPFSPLFAFSIAHTQTTKSQEKEEHNSYIWWPLHYCLSFCIEQDVKYFIYYILHIGLWLRLYIYYMYVAWPCTMGLVPYPNWLKKISSFLCGSD